MTMKKASARGARTDMDERTIGFIENVADEVLETIARGQLPDLKLPVRSLANVHYDGRRGYFELGQKFKKRTLAVKTARTFAQTLRMMAVSRSMVESNDFATKREAYYISKNWGDCRFDHQSESDAIMDDIEAMASMQGLSREQLRFYPESHGGSVAGRLTIIDTVEATRQTVEVDCTQLGSGAYTIPRSPEHLDFKSSARFVLAIETGGMFQRLNNHRFWERADCILVEMGGVPTRATRRFLRLLSDRLDLPVYCFVDCDPYGFTNIYRTLKVGSGNAAQINQFLSVPRARYLGVTPQDIVDFGLADATHPLEPIDIKRARDALHNDPFIKANPEWVSRNFLKWASELSSRALPSGGSTMSSTSICQGSSPARTASCPSAFGVPCTLQVP
jgi:DNA topoisomerase-6 subunit A